jgi:hypothetical protein
MINNNPYRRAAACANPNSRWTYMGTRPKAMHTPNTTLTGHRFLITSLTQRKGCKVWFIQFEVSGNNVAV